ncbi:MAG: hypothetical protein R2877_05850 [Bdellovibrionota bacterium]
MWGYLSSPDGKTGDFETWLSAEQKYLIVNQLLKKMEAKGFRSILKKDPRIQKLIFGG